MPDPTTPRTEPLPVCASSELVERGDAHVFDVLHFREPARAFVMRFEGRVVAYLNRCLHVPTEMDWQHGKFLDGDREYILCATHGAVFAPESGVCVEGPCPGARLQALPVSREGDELVVTAGAAGTR